MANAQVFNEITPCRVCRKIQTPYVCIAAPFAKPRSEEQKKWPSIHNLCGWQSNSEASAGKWKGQACLGLSWSPDNYDSVTLCKRWLARGAEGFSRLLFAYNLPKNTPWSVFKNTFQLCVLRRFSWGFSPPGQ